MLELLEIVCNILASYLIKEYGENICLLNFVWKI